MIKEAIFQFFTNFQNNHTALEQPKKGKNL